MSEEALAALYADYAANTPVLGELAEGRRLVPGHGPVNAPLVVLGEAPGAEEERQGRPFVGPSGRLLRRMLAEAGVPWGACYVMNVVPWRPPGNRTPYPFEVAASGKRVAAEIGIIGPEAVVAAGAVAWSALGGREACSARSAWFGWHDLDGGYRVLAVPHPSYILRLKGEEQARWRQETVSALATIVKAPVA